MPSLGLLGSCFVRWPINIVVLDPLLYTIPYVEALSRALALQGHQVTVAGRRLRPGDKARWQIRNVSYLALPIDEPAVPAGMGRLRRHSFWALQNLRYAVAILVAANRLTRLRPDVLHVQWALMPLIDRYLVHRLKAYCPAVITVHDTVPSNGDPVRRSRRYGWGTLLASFDAVIVHTSGAIDRLTRSGIPVDRLKRIPHGLLPAELEDASPRALPTPVRDSAAVQFLSLGYIRRYKGIDILIRGVALMRPELRDRCHFTIAGACVGLDTGELEALAKELQVSDCFCFRFEFIPDADIEGLMSATDALVFPYREIEASGALMLGVRYGKPMIASRLGLFKELLVEAETGLLVDRENPHALALALDRFVQDAALRLYMREQVTRLAATIPTWRDIAAQTVACYEAAIASHLKRQS